MESLQFCTKPPKYTMTWQPGSGSWFNSLRPGDVIWRHWSGLTLACCLMAPSHYLDQCLLIISAALWHSPKSHFTASDQATILHNEFENCTFKITATSPRGQWVNIAMFYQYWRWHGLTPSMKLNKAWNPFNSLAPGTFENNFREIIFKLILVIDGLGISREIALRWMLLDLADDKSALVWAMTLVG